jgi:hypothetical protein
MKPLLFILSALVITLCFSCTGKSPSETTGKSLNNGFVPDTGIVTWYYFTTDSFSQTDRPEAAPPVAAKPWTEAVRIASAGCSSGNGKTIAEAYAVVNRLGILAFNSTAIRLYPDTQLFRNTTAGNLVFQDDLPVFTFYKSAFFNTGTDTQADSPLRPFLVQFRIGTGLIYPLISYDNLKIPEDSEITGYNWDGRQLQCSVKQVSGNRTKFSYISIIPRVHLSDLTLKNSSGNIDVKTITVEEFRTARKPLPFAQAPAGLKKLLSVLPSDLAFSIECSIAGGVTPQTFIHGAKTDDDTAITAKACVTRTWVAALFTDGTTYVSGAFYNGQPVTEGSGKAFRLPRLPEGYRYSDFAVSGTMLYAAWEENSFYQTGRSGFLAVDLGRLLYRVPLKTHFQ